MNSYTENLLKKTAEKIVNQLCEMKLMPETSKDTAKEVIIDKIIDLIVTFILLP